MTRLVRAIIAGLMLIPLSATIALAHPLGNFTINHYAGIRVEPDRVLLDVVIDEAEIPTFQALMDLDEDGDGEFSDEELAKAQRDGCTAIGEALTLTVGGVAAPLRLIETGITFPPGNGGLSTMRQVCTYEARLASSFDGSTSVEFRDAFEASRIGWREITVRGSGVTVTGDELAAASTSGRLTTYPSGGLTGAPDMRSVAFTVTPGGPVLEPFAIPDAAPIEPIVIGGGERSSPEPSPTAASSTAAVSPSAMPSPTAASTTPASASAVAAAGSTDGGGATPGGESPIPGILRTIPVSPAVALLSLLTAALLGAGHALTPGHGKTLMAAYLAGTRGTARHALGLGAAVSVSHTAGILGLAMVVLAAESALPPDRIVRIAPIVAALTIVAIGGWMLATEIRRWLTARRRVSTATALDLENLPHEDHDQAYGDLEHAHSHPHVPPAGATITWRSLFVLGLAGGLIPSTNALLILLATIAAGQPAWGVVLVIGFGVGMAAVMTGVGLGFVYARGLLDRGAAVPGVDRLSRLVPLAAAVLVLGIGVTLTTQAIAAARIG